MSLEKFDLWNQAIENKNIILLERKSCCEFIDIVEHAEFVIADGCGNQQEFFYMGKPYLILRTKVEQDSEGIGWNAECFEGDYDKISSWGQEYVKYIKPQIVMDHVPSEVIADEIEGLFITDRSRRE